MTTIRIRLQSALDCVLAFGLSCLLIGASLAFGGAVWWFPAMVAGLTALLILAWLARAGLSTRWIIMKSPLSGLGLLALGLAAFQSIPMPARLSDIISPRTRSVHATGLLADLARSDDPDAVLPEPVTDRSPLTIDRSATLRWLGGSAGCLVMFWIVSHFTDRLGRLYVVWGSVLTAFLLNALIALIQIMGQSEGLYGYIEPGRGPKWAPNVADAIIGPGETVLRPVEVSSPMAHVMVLPRPGRARLLGTMMGGPGAHLALGAIGLPLALAVVLQMMTPRGSRDGLWTRLTESNQGSLLVMLSASTIAGAYVVGLLAGPMLAIPFVTGVAVVGLPSLFGTGLRWKGAIMTGLTLASLVGGVFIGGEWSRVYIHRDKLLRVDLSAAPAHWSDAVSIARDFPLVGTGLGSFSSIYPYYKSRDATSSTAMSSLLQWWVESGAVGLVLIGLAGLWTLVRLPGAIGRVGPADRPLAFGMIGAASCFGLLAIVHWTVELAAVSLAASAVAGTCNRWLAGGTDLFVQRG